MVVAAEAYLRISAEEALKVLEGRAQRAKLLGISSQLQAVANAFVVLGLVPEPDAEAILSEVKASIDVLRRPNSGVAYGELTLRPGAHGFGDARSKKLEDLQDVPLSVALPPPVNNEAGTVVIDSFVVSPSGLRGRARAKRTVPRASGSPAPAPFSEWMVTDDQGRCYPLHSSGGATITNGQEGSQYWWGEFVSDQRVPDDTSWLEITAPDSHEPTRMRLSPLRSIPTGTADPPWPTPAETYLAWLAPTPFATDADACYGVGLTMEDAHQVVAGVADALLAVGALPPQSSVLGRLPATTSPQWQRELARRWSRRAHQLLISDNRRAVTAVGARLPLRDAVAIVEYLSVLEDAVRLQLYVSPDVRGEYWPVNLPCFMVEANDESGGHYDTVPGTWRNHRPGEGWGDLLLWPPVAPAVKRLRVKVSTLWEAAWAEFEVPGR
jgi:hypothetical protein